MSAFFQQKKNIQNSEIRSLILYLSVDMYEWNQTSSSGSGLSSEFSLYNMCKTHRPQNSIGDTGQCFLCLEISSRY